MTFSPGDVMKATARLEWAGLVSIQNVFYAQITSGGGITDVAAMADVAEWLDDTYTFIVNDILSTVTFVDIIMYDQGAGIPLGVEPWPVLTAGGNVDDPLATGVALVTTAYTAINKVRGRKFWGLMGESGLTNGLVVAGVLSNLLLAAASWVAPFTGGTSAASWVPGIVRRSSGAFVPFSSVVARSIPGYQRRRKQDVGE